MARKVIKKASGPFEIKPQNENSQSPQGAGYKKIRNYLFSVQKATAFLYPLTAQGVFKVCDTSHLEISNPITASGGVSQTNESVWICMCGLTKNEPFCDGTHKLCGGEEEGKVYEYDENGFRQEISKK